MRRVSVNSDVERRGWTHLAEVCAVLNFSSIICSWIKYHTRVSGGFLYQDISGDPLFLLSIPNRNTQWLQYLIFYCQWFVEIHAELQSNITSVSVFIRMHQTCLVTDHLCAPEKLPESLGHPFCHSPHAAAPVGPHGAQLGCAPGKSPDKRSDLDDAKSAVCCTGWVWCLENSCTWGKMDNHTYALISFFVVHHSGLAIVYSFLVSGKSHTNTRLWLKAYDWSSHFIPVLCTESKQSNIFHRRGSNVDSFGTISSCMQYRKIWLDDDKYYGGDRMGC